MKILVAVRPPALYHVIESLLHSRPDFEIVGSPGSFRDLLHELPRLLPALIVMHVSPFKTDICSAVAAIKRSSPASKLLLMSAVEDLGYQARRWGADGYLHEDRLIAKLPGMAGTLATRAASPASCSVPTRKQTRRR